jgi:hypothetical protein
MHNVCTTGRVRLVDSRTDCRRSCLVSTLSPLTKLGRNSVDTGGDTAPTRHLAVEAEMAMLYAIINLYALGVLTAGTSVEGVLRDLGRRMRNTAK